MRTAEKLKLINAKRRLYRLILSKRTEELTDVEIELRYCLAKDRDIQAILEKNKKEGRREKTTMTWSELSKKRKLEMSLYGVCRHCQERIKLEIGQTEWTCPKCEYRNSILMFDKEKGIYIGEGFVGVSKNRGG